MTKHPPPSQFATEQVTKPRVPPMPHEPISRDAAIGMSARGWEGDIGDLYDCAEVATTLAEFVLNDEPTPRLSTDQVRIMLFAVYEVSRRIRSFKDTYYAAIEAEAVA